MGIILAPFKLILVLAVALALVLQFCIGALIGALVEACNSLRKDRDGWS